MSKPDEARAEHDRREAEFRRGLIKARKYLDRVDPAPVRDDRQPRRAWRP